MYEKKLIEARREAPQDANYAVEGYLSIFFQVETILMDTNIGWIAYTI